MQYLDNIYSAFLINQSQKQTKKEDYLVARKNKFPKVNLFIYLFFYFPLVGLFKLVS